MSDWTDPATISGLVTGVATIALVGATIVLAIFTKTMADRASEPLVTATIEPNNWSLMHADIVLANTGNATAFDLKTSFDPPLDRKSHQKTEVVPFQSVSVLRPGQVLRSYLSEFGPMMGKNYRVTVRWKRRPSDERLETLSYDLDMRTYDGFSSLGASDPQIQIAEQLKKIREDWDGVAAGSQRLKLDTYSETDRAEEATRRAERHEQMLPTRQSPEATTLTEKGD